nr:MAG TPA: Tetratricopeptide repeat [Caudoviricetes sp.]
MKGQEVKYDTPLIVRKLNEIKELFERKKYLEVISQVKQFKQLLDLEFLDYSHFDDKVAYLIFAGISYIELGLYENALLIFYDIEKRYENLKKTRHFWKNISQNPLDTNLFDRSKEALKLLKEQMQTFNNFNCCRYLSNMAYTCYKLERYKDAIKYYKKALIRNKKDVQLNLGIAQSQYYLYKSHLPKNIKKWYYKTIDMLYNSESNFDILLAIGKMYYFLKDYKLSLDFVQKALEFANNEPENKIYAYDWLSRIAYKTKHHSIAINFYEEVIKCLVAYPNNQQDVIHPKPKLYNMMTHLNNNKRIVRNQEMRAVWYTVIVSIIFTITFGIIDNRLFFKNLFNSLLSFCFSN